MNKEILHAIDIKQTLTISIIGGVLGLILALVPASYIVSLIVIIIGSLLLVTNGIIVYQNLNSKDSSNDLLLSIMGVLGGFLLIVTPNLLFIILVSLYLIVPHVIEMYKSKFNKTSIIQGVPYIVLGILLSLCAMGTLNQLFQSIGIIIMVISLFYAGYNYYLYKKSGVKIIK